MGEKSIDKYIGMKFYKYNDDKELLVYRLIDLNGKARRLNTDKKEYIKIDVDALHDDYIIINPDAYCNMMITNIKDKDNNVPDVYIVVQKANAKDPGMIIRQNYLSESKNSFNIMQDPKIYIGDCITKYNIVGDKKIYDYFDFEEIVHKFYIALYLDDTMGDIFECFPKSEQDKFNKALDDIKALYSKNKMITGVSRSIKDLFKDNLFLHNYRALYNIIQLNFNIDLGEQSHDSNGDIILNNKQHKMLEEALQSVIRIHGILKYDKDIDISKMVNNTHCLVSDKSGIIYFISYSIISNIVDNDIAKAFNI